MDGLSGKLNLFEVDQEPFASTLPSIAQCQTRTFLSMFFSACSPKSSKLKFSLVETFW
jgi:hypothetical protein